MTFLHPWSFSFLGLIPVIVLLYLLKVKRRTAPVSTLMFWQRVLVENRRRALFQRLRQVLSLLLHLLIFALILLALARPEAARLLRAGNASTVVVLDLRARMGAVEDDGETRFAKAKRQLAAHARHASPRHVMALLTVGGENANVLAPFTDDEKAIRQAVENLAPTDAAGDLAAAVRLAEELLAARPGEKRILMVTDRPAEDGGNHGDGASRSKADGVTVETIAVGAPRENVAITRFAARPMFTSPQTSQVLLEVRNFGNRPQRGNVELFHDERLIDVKPFDLAPDARHAEVFTVVPPAALNSRGWLRARLDLADSLAADNEAFAVVPAREKKRVLLVTRGNWFLEKMLAAEDRTHWELLAPEAFRPELAESFDAVILDHALPPGFDLAMVRGNFLFLKQTPFSLRETTLEQPLPSDIDERSPLLRQVVLQNVTFLRATPLKLPAEGEPGAWRFDAPLRSFDHPLIITGERRRMTTTLQLPSPATTSSANSQSQTREGEQRLAAFAFDVTETDLPLRVAFPLLMANTLQWLAGEKEGLAPAVRAGETVALGHGQTVQTEPHRGLSPAPEADAAAGAAVARDSFQPLRNGWYLAQGDQSRRADWLAVNTFSDAESDLRFDAPAAGSAPASAPAPAQRLLSLAAISTAWPLWTYLAFAALLLFSIEWRLFHRRRTE